MFTFSSNKCFGPYITVKKTYQTNTKRIRKEIKQNVFKRLAGENEAWIPVCRFVCASGWQIDIPGKYIFRLKRHLVFNRKLRV
jgi:hypothetical protein